MNPQTIGGTPACGGCLACIGCVTTPLLVFLGLLGVTAG